MNQFSRVGRRRAWMLALLLPALTACTSGDTSNGGGSSEGGGSSPGLYDYWLNATQLRTQVRDDFSSSFASNVGRYSHFSHVWLFTPNTNGSGGMAQDSANSTLLYINSNHFYRLASYGSSLLQPVQVSSEGTADGICSWHGPQRQTPDNLRAVFKYRLPGSDRSCYSADDVFREIRLDMGSSDVPQTISLDRFRADEIYAANGDLAGYLVAAAAGGIYWYDASFANPRQIAAASGVSDANAGFIALANSPDGRYRLLQLQGSGVFVLDIQTQTMNKVAENGVIDSLGYYAGNFYLAQSINGAAKSALRVPVDGSLVGQAFLTGLDQVPGIAGEYLVYQKNNASGTDIYSLNLGLDGASARLIKRLDAQEQVSLAGGRLYYTVRTLSGGIVSSVQALSLLPDGSDEFAFSNGIWVGRDYRNGEQPNYPLLASDHMYLAQDVKFSGNGVWSGGRLSWVHAATGRLGGNIGALPANVYAYRFASSDSFNTVLGLGYSADAKTTYYLRANRLLGKVASIDQSPTDNNYRWKGDWSVAP